MNIISRLPTEESVKKISAEYGKFNKQRLKLSMSGPISDDSLMAGFTLFYSGRDGFVENLNPNGPDLMDEDRKGLETKLRWKLSDETEIIFSADYQKADETGVHAKPTLKAVDGSIPGLGTRIK